MPKYRVVITIQTGEEYILNAASPKEAEGIVSEGWRTPNRTKEISRKITEADALVTGGFLAPNGFPIT